ncbi:hypothetical protein CTA2_5838 [Colletotrichum tanaceti]|uniref:Uncharacterized protein n=1 Tax=Colletotrichum tanaceti TaxID=1306861 RepID=A0A4V6DID1_9PEZI|nr:hypothetical protein CTA2_5838 [Colletotrichum tanaceti]TKW59266.1 hypothetical protein CTA1_7152 [Colletotrichum tanaceti]
MARGTYLLLRSHASLSPLPAYFLWRGLHALDRSFAFRTLAFSVPCCPFTRLQTPHSLQRAGTDRMAKRDSLTVWLPKEMYGSVEPFADDRYIWCPMPFDESLPIEQTSFIDMGNSPAQPANRELTTHEPPAVLAGPGNLSTSDTESDGEVHSKKIGHNLLGRGRRRPSGMQPARQKRSAIGSGSRGSRGFAVHLGLDLDIEVTLKAKIFGNLEMSAL